MWTIVFLVLAIVVVVWVLSRKTQAPTVSRETKMVALDLEPASSYAQKTNHFPATPVEMGPIAGFETPFRVNMFKAYME
jgi:flagellar basal body-associated protein FliL